MDLKPSAFLSSDQVCDFSWNATSEESKNVAETHLLQGEFKLLQGNFSEGMEYFESASNLDPSNPNLFYRQGLALFEHGSEEENEKILLLASKKFKRAVALKSDLFEALHAWGNTLAFLGELQDEHHYFIEAEEKYAAALSLCQNQKNDVLSDLYWDCALIWSHLSDHSQEAVDVQRAIQFFQKACVLVHHMPVDFWIDFGHASLKLASLINDSKLYVKAINYFKIAISQGDEFFESWKYLAGALEKLYYHTHDDDHLSRANECYATSASLQPQDTDLLLNWARLLCYAAKKTQDTKHLKLALEKCHRAYATDPTNPLILAIWGEALALLGELSDRLDLIVEAQNKLSEALDLEDEENPEVLFSYGMCLNALGRYFNDFDYHYQAIEKFQLGLSMDRTCHRLWHAIAQTYLSIGVLENDIDTLEKSLKFFKTAISLDSNTYYIYDYALALSKMGELAQFEDFLQQAVFQFEHVLSLQKNALYLHPDWLFQFGCTLDMLGDFHEEESYYTRAIELFSHVLMIDPEFSGIHHRIAQALSHLGELSEEVDYFYRALHHLRLAAKQNEEDDQILLDWGLVLIHIAEQMHDAIEMEQVFQDAEHKLTQAAKLGNLQAYYFLGCLYSILRQYENAMYFILKADAFKSLPPIEELLQDEWLDGLRTTDDFRQLLFQMENRPHLRE